MQPTELLPRPFVYLRHGETTFNAARIIGGHLEAPLNERGRQQASANAPLLKHHRWSAIFSSDLSRARQTAQLAVPGQPVCGLAALRERNWGELEGKSYHHLPESCLETPAGGESWQDFSQRVSTALNQILEQHHLPLIVAHSGTYRVIRGLTLGSPLGQRVDNATPLLVLPPDPEQGYWQLEPLQGDWRERLHQHGWLEQL
ncbi:histidine phosphatase family protein [Balneatrix alpica]|uniref:Histidine phosphatase family protein n=1 Tax=Balneatrix alpica TaxID=75684 RepID=A0ABV5ZFN1_9GAMM|nr:histidine phosphatase family protein [Balneatrix alpica]